MGKKDRLSRDQKRKKKLAERAKSSRGPSALAYTGNKYKTDAYVPYFQSTETGIYETFVMTDRKLTDRDVRAALERLIVQLRQDTLPPLEDSGAVEVRDDRFQDLIIWNIRRNWQDQLGGVERAGRDGLIGVLRTILNSIGVWGTPSAQSRGYLNYIEGFLRKMGVSVRKVSPEGEPEPEPPQERLLAAGRDWCAGDEQAGEDFRDLAEEMIAAGQSERVAEIAQSLIGETGTEGPFRDLSLIAIRAQQATESQMG